MSAEQAKPTQGEFIADASATYPRTGLTPSELAEQREELLKTLESVTQAADEMQGRLVGVGDYACADKFAKGHADYRRHTAAVESARAAIAKAKGGAQ